jgi:hypothetical protein
MIAFGCKKHYNSTIKPINERRIKMNLIAQSSSMVTIKAAQLTGKALHWAVAKSE